MSGPSNPGNPGYPGASPHEFFAETDVPKNKRLRHYDTRRGIFARVMASQEKAVQTAAPRPGLDVPEFLPDGLVYPYPPEAPLQECDVPPTEIDATHYIVDARALPDILPPPEAVPVPAQGEGNIFYDGLRTRSRIYFLTEYNLTGNVSAPAAGTSFTQTLTTAQGSVQPYPVRLRLTEYPYSMQAYVLITGFTAAPRVLTDTGTIAWAYIGRDGRVTTLAITPASIGVNESAALVIPDPITDATPADLGSFRISSSTGATITTTWDWAFNIGIVYMKPGSLRH